MSANILDDVWNFLVAQGAVEGSTGWKCYEGYMPDDQNLTVGLFESPGMMQDTMARENVRPKLVVHVRGNRLAYSAVRAKWQEIWDLLQDAQDSGGGSPHTLSGYTYIQAEQSSPLCFNDANNRPNMTANFQILKARE